MLAHGKDTRNMQPMEFLGNLILLIVGGNDTTRNSISGGVLALNENAHLYQKLRDDTSVITSMVPEIIRWQTPLAYMRKTVLNDTEAGGKHLMLIEPLAGLIPGKPITIEIHYDDGGLLLVDTRLKSRQQAGGQSR